MSQIHVIFDVEKISGPEQSIDDIIQAIDESIGFEVEVEDSTGDKQESLYDVKVAGIGSSPRGAEESMTRRGLLI